MTAKNETVMVEVGGAIAPSLNSVVQTVKSKLSKIGESYETLKYMILENGGDAS